MPLARITLTFNPEGPASATCVLLVLATLLFGSSTSASAAAPFRFRPRFLLMVASSTCTGVLVACLDAFRYPLNEKLQFKLTIQSYDSRVLNRPL